MNTINPILHFCHIVLFLRRKITVLYSREEAKKLKESFWIAFGQYMRAVPFADGERLNWINYKTGIKYLYFRMDADAKQGIVTIEIAHSDEGIRALMFEQFAQLRAVLEDELSEEWVWEPRHINLYGKEVARIYTTIKPANVFNKEDWPNLISFFKPRIIALDSFWSIAKYAFEIFK